MNNLNNGTYDIGLTHDEAIRNIAHADVHTAFFIEGDTGIGKSSILIPLIDYLNNLYPDDIPYESFFIDGLASQDGDWIIPTLSKQEGIIEQQILQHMKENLCDKKSVCFIDEASKMPRGLKKLTGTMVRERRIGKYPIHEGTRFVLTGNLVEEGFNDAFDPTQGNRWTTFRLKKPTGEEWVENYASPRKLNPLIQWFALEKSAQLGESFTEVNARKYKSNEDINVANPFIFNPLVPKKSFVTFRSLEIASGHLDRMDLLGKKTTYHNLLGSIGAPATQEVFRAITMGDKLPHADEVINNPDTAKVPERGACSTIMVHKLLNMVSIKNYKAVWTYLLRMEIDCQFMFLELLKKRRTNENDVLKITEALARLGEFTKWCSTNSWGFSEDKK